MELTVRSCILWEPQKQQTPVQVRWVEDEPPGPKSSCKAKQKWDFVERLTKLPNDFSFKDIRFFQPFSPFENLFRSLKLFYIINCVIKLNSCKDLQRLQKSKKGFEKLKNFFDFLNFLWELISLWKQVSCWVKEQFFCHCFPFFNWQTQHLSTHFQ